MATDDGIKADLVEFYDTRAAERAASTLRPDRSEARATFVGALANLATKTIVDIGIGAGQDALAMIEAGFDIVGVDLSWEHCRWAVRRGAAAAVADFYSLPFAPASIDAAWCASAYIHVPADHLGQVLAETRRVLRTGAVLMIGVWCGEESEGVRVEGTVRRFYSIKTAGQWLDLVRAYFDVERWWTDDSDPEEDYLWCLVRAVATAADEF